MMKFKSSLTAMIGDFANLNRTPDFKAKSDNDEKTAEQKAGAGGRRHSLNITVGAEEVPVIPRRNRSESICVGTNKVPGPLLQNKNRRCSAPCVSTSSASASFKAKMKKLKSKDDTFCEEKMQNETISEEEEEEIMHKMANQRERRPSTYLL